MSLHPFLKGLHDILGGEGFAKFFIDDGNLAGPFTQMVQALEYIQKVGPQYGFIIKRTKGAYLMGKCPSLAEAIQRKSELVSTFGLSEAIVHIHPDNTSDADVKHYGATVLGSFR